MAQWFKKLSPKAAELWGKLSPGRRITFLAGVALLIGTLVLVASTVRTTNYLPLFTEMNPVDAGEILQILKDDKVPYQLTESGTAILVPSNVVYETRIKLATAGLPRGGTVGFELFNQNSLGTTDFERKLKYNWALQGELTRTIREMREVEDARVHIVLPERSLFVSEENQPTASVLLRLKPYIQLTEGQIKGIANLVAYSVEGMKPENVTILDSNSNILSESLNFNHGIPLSGDAITTQLKIKEATEKRLEDQVKTMLERVFGLGKVVTRVNAELNFAYKESLAETFAPVVDEAGVVRSEQEYTENYTGGGGGAPIGVPGIDSNIPSYQAVDPERDTTQYAKRDLTRNYEVNKINEKVISPPGSIQRLTVAVWLDGQLPPEQLAQVRSAVESAVGYSAGRGDKITIESMAFERIKLADFDEVPGESKDQLVQYWPYFVVLLIAILGGVVVLLRRRSEQRGEPGLDMLIDQIEGEDTESLSESRQLEERLREFSRQKPQEAAKLLRTWLMEDEA